MLSLQFIWTLDVWFLGGVNAAKKHGHVILFSFLLLVVWIFIHTTNWYLVRALLLRSPSKYICIAILVISSIEWVSKHWNSAPWWILTKKINRWMRLSLISIEIESLIVIIRILGSVHACSNVLIITACNIVQERTLLILSD